MLFRVLIIVTTFCFVTISFISTVVDKAIIVEQQRLQENGGITTKQMSIDWTTRVDVVPTSKVKEAEAANTESSAANRKLLNTINMLEEKVLTMEKELKRKSLYLSAEVKRVSRRTKTIAETLSSQPTPSPTSNTTIPPTPAPSKQPQNIVQQTISKIIKEKNHQNEEEDEEATMVSPHHDDTNLLPTCIELMNRSDGIFKDGAFLTRPTTEVVWKVRTDGSRELTLPHVCTLHRYTSKEAQQCLSGHHIAFIGDSLSRYQYLSLAHFIENYQYPPRFGKMNPCKYINEEGIPQCSKPGTRNVCFEGEYKSWQDLYMDIGGGDDGGVFNGRAQCSCARLDKSNSTDDDFTQSMHYVSKEIATTSNSRNKSNKGKDSHSHHHHHHHNRVKLTLLGEVGWDLKPSPINMWNFSNCSYDGTCRHSREYNNELISKAYNKSWDWSMSLKDALKSSQFLNKNDTTSTFSDVDITLYNRGLWNQMTTSMAKEMMPLFYEWSGGTNGRCFYKSSTGSTRVRSIKTFLRSNAERDRVFEETIKAGCGYFDVGHVTREFMEFVVDHPEKHKRNGGISIGELGGRFGNYDEFSTIFWDAVHYAPWVYEEINNLLLNVLCNVQS